MIDPKELRVGAHVMVDGVRARVIRIDEPMENEIPPCTLIRFKAIIDGEVRDCGGSADSDKIQPIPITAELLEEFGFEKRESGSFAKEYSPDSWIFITLYATKDKCKVNVYPSDPRKEASCVLDGYLHELEAFLYLTTKTELIKD